MSYPQVGGCDKESLVYGFCLVVINYVIHFPLFALNVDSKNLVIVRRLQYKEAAL